MGISHNSLPTPLGSRGTASMAAPPSNRNCVACSLGNAPHAPFCRWDATSHGPVVAPHRPSEIAKGPPRNSSSRGALAAIEQSLCLVLEQHLAILGQRPEIVLDHGLETIGNLAHLGHRWDDLITEGLALGLELCRRSSFDRRVQCV